MLAGGIQNWSTDMNLYRYGYSDLDLEIIFYAIDVKYRIGLIHYSTIIWFTDLGRSMNIYKFHISHLINYGDIFYMNDQKRIGIIIERRVTWYTDLEY